MAVRIQFRRGTAAEWASANPTLAAGELGYEVDTAKFKLGDASTAWNSLAYAGVNQQDIEDAVAAVIDFAPEDLDTLVELAAAIGDDPNFSNTIGSAVADAEANAITYANGLASSAQANAQSYTDNAIANLINSSPGTLDTLNELAAALGDDPNFSTTVTNSLANRIEFVTDTAANFATANAVLDAQTFGITSDTRRVKVGDGVQAWNDMTWLGEDLVLEHLVVTTNVHGISDTSNLVYQSELTSEIANVNTYIDTTANTISDSVTTLDGKVSTLETTSDAHDGRLADLETASNSQSNSITTITSSVSDIDGRTNTLEFTTTTLTSSVGSLETRANDLEGRADVLENTVVTLAPLSGADLANPTISGASLEGTTTLAVDATVGGVTPTELGHLIGVTSGIQAQIDDKASVSSPTFGGEVILPATTTIGNVLATEIAQLENVGSNIQNQLDAKLAIASAASIYAPIANATLTGTISLPATTSIGDVSSTEISYINGVTSAIQTQLDAKLASATAASTYAPIDSPTFTTAVTMPAQTDIGNVSATEIGYLEGVTSALQTQLDAKAALSGAVFTGEVEATDLTVTGNLIVQGTTSTISTSDLKVKDNMIYLNQAGASVLTDAVGDGTNVVYTTAEAHGYDVGDDVTVANTTPSSFDIASPGLSIIAVTENTFTVASTVTDTYVSGGNARGKVHSNPDLGWAAGRYDTVNGSGYAHAGVFRDATDGVFKFFDGYVPEPDESAFIDTSDNTFALAPLEVAEVTAANLIATTGVVFPDSTVQTSAGVPSLTGFTEKTASYTLDTLDHQDNVVEMNSGSAVTFTIPTNASLAWPVGASMDIIQTGAGQVTISPDTGVTLNFTPGNKLRTQWSSCTIMKRGTDSWILYGDLTA